MSLFRIVSISFITIVLVLLGIILYVVSPTSFSGEEVRFVVPLSAKNDDTVNQLVDQKFIRSKDVFNFLSGVLKFPGTIDPGAYRLRKNMTLIELTNTLLYVPYQKWAVLVPGLRKEQVTERLGKSLGWDDTKASDFLASAREGYLFPDTYLLPLDETGAQIEKRLESRFNEVFTADMQQKLFDLNLRNDTAVKIASLIERESGGESDKRLIAGIIYNRILKGMRLQLDAANQYIIGEPGNWWPTVTPEDLKIDSPYNLYLNKGLPPTPISNPSQASLEAVANPEETDCLFYLHDHEGQIHCAVTYEEHKENIATYL
jgi:UPF0755 protein